MICKPCTEGKHCGKQGEVTQSCFCQHWPRKKVGKVKITVQPKRDEGPIITHRVQVENPLRS